MTNSSKWFGRVALFGLVAGVVVSPAAHGQFQARPGLAMQQSGNNLGGNQLVGGSIYSNPYGGGAITSFPAGGAAALDPFGSGSVYSSPYSYYNPNYDPAGGALRGAADVINSQGRFMVYQQEAFLAREQVRKEKINNRRRAFDEYIYERERTPTAEEERQKFMNEQISRSRNNPPITEIYSGKALNDLMVDLKRTSLKGDSTTLRNFQVNLEDDAMKHINLTKGTGNLGILKNEGKLSWPLALNGPELKEERERMSSLTAEAVKQAGFNGQVDAATIRQLMADSDKLKKELKKTGNDIPMSLYIEAKTFLNNIDDAVKTLQQADAGSFVTGKYSIKAKTVPELVKFMSESGLQFAPAVPGDENAYVALHQALASYDRTVQPTEK